MTAHYLGTPVRGVVTARAEQPVKSTPRAQVLAQIAARSPDDTRALSRRRGMDCWRGMNTARPITSGSRAAAALSCQLADPHATSAVDQTASNARTMRVATPPSSASPPGVQAQAASIRARPTGAVAMKEGTAAMPPTYPVPLSRL